MSYIPTNADDFVTAVNSRGEKQQIPRRWVDHPVLGVGFTVAPSQANVDLLAAGPDETWTRAQLDDYAEAHGVDTTGASTKGDVLDAITTHTQTTGPIPGTDETPDAGDDEEN